MSHRYIVSGPRIPRPAAPISHAVVAGNHCFVSGQLATDATGALRGGAIRSEAMLAFENLFSILAAAGFTRQDLVYVDVALLDIGHMLVVNQVWADCFPRQRPARTIYQAAALPYGGKIKVQGVAVRNVRSS